MRARAVARRMVEIGFDRGLHPHERMFVYLPFEHGETIEDQNESVRLFETLRGELNDSTIDYAYRHRDVIEQFGRFPHRNPVLGRRSTEAEIAFLEAGGFTG